jgi:uncharacterized protein with GYD domain
MQGVILIKTVQAKDNQQVTKDITRAARKIAGVTESFSVLGRYDNVIFIEGNDFDALRTISNMVGALEGVKTTETLCEAD